MQASIQADTIFWLLLQHITLFLLLCYVAEQNIFKVLKWTSTEQETKVEREEEETWVLSNMSVTQEEIDVTPGTVAMPPGQQPLQQQQPQQPVYIMIQPASKTSEKEHFQKTFSRGVIMIMAGGQLFTALAAIICQVLSNV